MKALSIKTRGSINLTQRAILEAEEPPGDETCARTYSWTRTSNYLWATSVVAAGLSLHFYYVREMLASLALFSLLFLSVAVVVLSVFVVWYAGNQAAAWSGHVSRAVISFCQQLGRGGMELSPVSLAEKGLDRSQTQKQIGRKP